MIILDFFTRKEELKFKIMDFRKELYSRILEAENNKDLKLRFELYKVELTLERAIYITALDDAIKEYKKNSFKNKNAIYDFYHRVSECNERLFALLEEELDLLDERAYDECRAL
ncbi:MAG: hypothetical protein MSH30_02755 [Campylobacter sp.]|nr:hypothetical protein [Campylobacter sp.]